MQKKLTPQLSLKTLDDCGFKIVNLAFQQELGRVLNDMEERPGDTKDRVIDMSFVFSPVAGSQGIFQGAALTVKMNSKLPKIVIQPKMLYPAAGGKGLSPDDPEQQMMNFEPEPEEKNKED